MTYVDRVDVGIKHLKNAHDSLIIHNPHVVLISSVYR